MLASSHSMRKEIDFEGLVDNLQRISNNLHPNISPIAWCRVSEKRTTLQQSLLRESV